MNEFEGYDPSKKNDKPLLAVLWCLLNDADIVVAQNGDEFDIKKINTRFLLNGMTPPSPYRTVDTLKAARGLAFNSNKLNDLGRDMGEGEKEKHMDFSVWLGCMAGDKPSWEKMRKYNKRDVDLLERIYLRLRPWMKVHPNCGSYAGKVLCPKCGSTHITMRGTMVSLTHRYKRFQCSDCGSWSKLTTGEKTTSVVNV